MITYSVNDDVYARCWHDAALYSHLVADVVAPFVRPNCEEHD